MEDMNEQITQPQYYADVDDSGNIVGFYVDQIHGIIPETAVEIAEELWQQIGGNTWRYKWDGSQIREKTQQELADERANQPAPQPTPQERIEVLEDENALLALELAQTQLRLDQAEQEQADLLLMLISQGVI